MPDIDIDFADRDIILSQLKHRVAKLNTGKKHNTGVYATEIPHNPIDNLATVEHKAADERGYFKLDFLNVGIYKDVKDETHLTELMEKEPLWQLLEHEDFSEEVWTKPEEGYYFKKAHAISYAMACVVHINLLCDKINELGGA